MPTPAEFWWGVSMACLVWFSTVTVYVAVRGAFDIRHMFERLKRTRELEDEEAREGSDHGGGSRVT